MHIITWAKDRLLERTTWDGGVCVALGFLVLFMAPLAKIADLPEENGSRKIGQVPQRQELDYGFPR